MKMGPLRGGALTSRETEVLKLIGAGLSNLEISAQLGIRFNTVVSHRAHIMDKLDVHNRASLARCWKAHGW